ncbi:ORF6N domain-containing protein [Bacteroides sp.]
MDELTVIENKIYEIRGQKVMLDFDLAEMYGVETKNLNKAVKRNIERFPEDFMFQLTTEERSNLRFQIGTSSWGGTRYLPFAFTEQGVAMLSGILRSSQAIEINIKIIRAFVRMRQYMLSNVSKQELDELRKRIEYLEEDVSSDRESYESQFEELFTAFAKVSAIIQSKTNPLDRVKIQGFKNKDDK